MNRQKEIDDLKARLAVHDQALQTIVKICESLYQADKEITNIQDLVIKQLDL